MSNRHLVTTRARLVRCKVCRCVIWFAWSEGEPTYCDVDDLDLLEEIELRLKGRRTYNYRPALGLWYRSQWTLNHKGAVFAEHIHRNGYDELEPRCPTETSKKATDLSEPPF